MVARGKASLISVRSFHDIRCRLSVLESGVDLPFIPRRLYYLYDSNPGHVRGGHAHRELVQCMIAVHGTVMIDADDGQGVHTFVLDNPQEALLLMPIIWREIRQLSGSILCVLASNLYDESDYKIGRAHV